MKITVPQSELASAVSISSRAVSTSSILPILSGAKLVAEKDNLHISATDLEITIHCAAAANVEEEGKAVIPARLLADVVKSMSEGSLEIEVDHAEGQAKLRCGKTSYAIKELPIEDYPRLPEWEGDGKITLSGSSLSEAIRQVIKAVGRDEARPVLSGVLMAVGDGKLSMVATDSYRLAAKEVDLSGVEEGFEVIVPARAMEELGKLCGAETVKVEVGENQIGFRAGDVVLVSRLIEGQYPKYQQLIPTSCEARVRFDRDQMISAVKRVSLVSQGTAIVRTVVGEDSVKLSAYAQDVGSAEDVVECEVEGGAMEIAFNAQYLLDGLSAVTGKNARLELISPSKPGLLKPEEADDFLYLVMPVRLT